MGVIADLLVRVGSDISGAKLGLAEVSTDVEAAGSGAGRLGAMFLGAGALAVAGIGGVAAFGVAAVDHMTEAGQAAFEMSEKFGIAADSASAWIAVGAQLGLTGDQIGTGYKFLAKNMEALNLQHEKGKPLAGDLAKSFKELGVNVFDAHGHLMDEQSILLEVATAFSKMPDGPEKAGLAMKLFGKEGADLIPLLNQGRAGIEKLMASGKAMGDVMSTDQVEAAHKLYLEHQKLDASISGLENRFAAGLLPIGLQVTTWLSDTAVPAVIKFGTPIEQQLIPALGRFAGWLKTLGPDLRTAFNIISTLAPFVAGVAAAWVLWNVALAVTEGIQVAIMAIQFVGGIIQIVRTVGLWTAAQWLLNVALDANPIGVVVIALGLLVAGVIWAYKNVGWFRDAINSLWGGLQQFGGWLSSHFGPIMAGIGQLLADIFTGQWGRIGSDLAAIKSAFSAGGGGPAVSSRLAPKHFASGGQIGREGGWVGEGGMEYFQPDVPGTIYPNGPPGGGHWVQVYVTSPADAYDIAAEVGWELNKLRRRR